MTSKKLITAISMTCLMAVLLVVGVWAVSDIDFSVGGNIEYTTPEPAIDAEEVSYLTFEYDSNNYTAELVACSSSYEEEKLEIPSKVSYNGKTYTITSIRAGGYDSSMDMAYGVFNDCYAITEIILPDTITEIKELTFCMASITSITLGDGVEKICNRAFLWCWALQNVDFGANVKFIGARAFDNCPLEKLNIPDSVTYIEQDAFNNCSNLTRTLYDNAIYLGSETNPYLILTEATSTSITSCSINSKCKTIGATAFKNCTGLTSITIPDSVTSIGYDAFLNCTNLTYNTYNNAKYLGNSTNPYVVLVSALSTDITLYTINSGCKVIYTDAFMNRTKLTSITIPNSVTSIGQSAFYGCTGLTSITIPDGVTSIGNDAFSDCTGLTSITIPDGVTSIGNDAFSSCTGLTSVTIGSGVTSIGEHAFGLCTGLTSITIPDSVTSIYNRSFYHCTGLTSITIPDSVTSIGEHAFTECTKLAKVEVKATTPPTGGSNMFNNCSSSLKIYVPTASESAYKSATYWSTYSSKIYAGNF